MYSVDSHDRVLELRNVPQSSVGAPLPLLLSREGTTVLAYLVEDRPPDWDGGTVRLVSPETPDAPAAIVVFRGCRATFVGPPNEEAFAGHPLAPRGLHPYGAFEIARSSWVGSLEQMNRVHPNHDPARFQHLRHFVWAFHDSTFECVAEAYETS